MTILELMEALEKTTNQKSEESEVEVLTGESLEQLKRMTTYQLDAIYKHGKRKVKIADNDPEAYKQLNDMTTFQLKAIFGDN